MGHFDVGYFWLKPIVPLSRDLMIPGIPSVWKMEVRDHHSDMVSVGVPSVDRTGYVSEEEG